MTLVYRIRSAGAGFRSLAEDTTSAGTLAFHVFASIAQFERERIAERTREGLDAARRRGRVGGRPLPFQQSIAPKCADCAMRTSAASLN